RPPPRLHLDALGQGADLHDGARRQERAADHENGQQRKTGLVSMTGELMMKAVRSIAAAAVAAALITSVACGKKNPPVARPMPPPPPPADTQPLSRPPAPPDPVREPTSIPAEPVRDDAISSASLDDLNKNSPLKPVFFELDSSDLSAANQKVLDEDAALLKRYPSWA